MQTAECVSEFRARWGRELLIWVLGKAFVQNHPVCLNDMEILRRLRLRHLERIAMMSQTYVGLADPQTPAFSTNAIWRGRDAARVAKFLLRKFANRLYTPVPGHTLELAENWNAVVSEIIVENHGVLARLTKA